MHDKYIVFVEMFFNQQDSEGTSALSNQQGSDT